MWIKIGAPRQHLRFRLPVSGPVGADGASGDGAPPEPPPALCFLRLCGVAAGTPPETGAVGGENCWTGFSELPPPLDAMAITAIRSSATHPSATSLRRR
jgi:hypothetical protein